MAEDADFGFGESMDKIVGNKTMDKSVEVAERTFDELRESTSSRSERLEQAEYDAGDDFGFGLDTDSDDIWGI